MTTSYSYTAQAIARQVHTCPSCGARMHVTLDAIGSTAYIPDHLDTLAAREEAINAAVSADARGVAALVRCPHCRERAQLPVAFAIARVVIWFALVPVLPIIAPGPLDVLWIVPIGLAVMGIAQLLRERSRFRRADSALIVPLTPPTRQPASKAPPRARAAELPVARATKVPSVMPPRAAPAAAPAPAALSAPPSIIARDPSSSLAAEPTFLTSSDRTDG